MKAIEEMLRWEAEGWERLGISREQNLQMAVFEHGQVYELDRAASAPNGKLRECFQNAALAAFDSDGELTYVEGFACRSGLLVHHAWVVNAEGKALEVTWRDGTRECGYCRDGEIELDEDDEGYDEDDESTWVTTCRWCGGTGECDAEHPTLQSAQYFGIAIEKQTLIEILCRNDVWGALNTSEDLQTILAAHS
jgi:hypothetical protein